MHKSAHILVLDPDPLNRVVLQNTLEETYFVTLSSSQEQAQGLLKTNSIDLIIMDNQQLGGAAEPFLQALKANADTAQLPVIVISASASFLDEADSLQQGAVDYITKPFNPNIVKARVKIHLSNKQRNDQLSQQVLIDSMTSLPNRRALNETLSTYWRQCASGVRPLAVFVLGVDHFERYNQLFGHASGDECLCKIAQVVSGLITNMDGFTARHDGGRFVALLRDISEVEVLEVSEAIHKAVAALAIRHPASPTCAHVTVSVGICYTKADFSRDHNEPLDQAAMALNDARERQQKAVLNVV
ncbi:MULTISPECIES: diguanylate cyclase [unclassified Pseudoalteromonas]|uniref:GGDEF domain-containing response regulator n=1 Tax=unclassified Pseudoalteromonas TaxID=194690 RepID=UPI002096F70F|nr:diguanylate cyclase [Pseudoalteromonas sp. XMcav2-N]MCO7191293.1 diguanylate cyclase [Pseudoalteromonas sp. XMcav2-N]